MRWPQLLLSGARKPGRFLCAGCSWVASGHSWRCTALFSLIRFMLRQFRDCSPVASRPYNADAFSRPIAVFVSVFLIYHWVMSSWFSRPELSVVGGDLPFPAVPAGLHTGP